MPKLTSMLIGALMGGFCFSTFVVFLGLYNGSSSDAPKWLEPLVRVLWLPMELSPYDFGGAFLAMVVCYSLLCLPLSAAVRVANKSSDHPLNQSPQDQRISLSGFGRLLSYITLMAFAVILMHKLIGLMGKLFRT